MFCYTVDFHPKVHNNIGVLIGTSSDMYAWKCKCKYNNIISLYAFKIGLRLKLEVLNSCTK